MNKVCEDINGNVRHCEPVIKPKLSTKIDNRRMVIVPVVRLGTPIEQLLAMDPSGHISEYFVSNSQSLVDFNLMDILDEPSFKNSIKKAYRWNEENKLTVTLLDTPSEVRGTSYGEVHELIGTSGCSRTPEMWTWSVMGILETTRGRLVVNPGDWIVEILPDCKVVLSNEQYLKYILEDIES